MILDQNQHVLNWFWPFNGKWNNKYIGGSLFVVPFLISEREALGEF